MKVYSPSDIAMILQIKPATLRKYSTLLEKYGYEIERNSQGHRYYRDKDIIALRNVISGSNSGATLEDSVKNVVFIERGGDVTNDIKIGDIANDNDMRELKDMMYKQNEMMQKQNDLILGLTKRLDEQQVYFDNQLKEHNQILIESNNETLKAQNEVEEEKAKQKGFFTKLFGK